VFLIASMTASWCPGRSSSTGPGGFGRLASTAGSALPTFAEFEVDLLRLRTREGLAIARANGKLRGKQPKLSVRQRRELARMAGTGEYAIADLAEVFTISRATVYRTLQRAAPPPAAS
jgi:DNA invertase Pin-like site-specific DNA recombinase